MNVLQRFRKKASTSAQTRSRPGPIGLDIGGGNLHMCQMRSLDMGRFSILAKCSTPFEGSREALLASPAKMKQLFNTAFRGSRFKGRKVVALMPWEEVKIILLTYKSSVSDVDAEVVKMLVKRIDGRLEDYVIDYIPVRSNPSDEEHMVVATVALKARVERFLKSLIACGLEVESLDIAPTALRRLVSSLYSGESADNVLLINTYPEESYLTIVSGRRLLYNQTVSFGANKLLQRISQTLEVTVTEARDLVSRHGLESRLNTPGREADDNHQQIASTLREILKPCFLELVAEINRVMIFTASETHGVPVSRVCLLGGIGEWPGARQLLLSLLEFDTPDGQIEFNQIFEDENDNTLLPWEGLFSDMSIAMGLSLRGLVE